MIKKLEDMAYDVSFLIEEASMCLEETDEESLKLAKKDLKAAFSKVTRIEVALKQLNEFMEQTKELLDGNN